MTKASKKLADLLAKQEETARQIAEIQKQAATEIGQIAVGAGIHTLDLTKKTTGGSFQRSGCAIFQRPGTKRQSFKPGKLGFKGKFPGRKRWKERLIHVTKSSWAAL